MRPTILLADDCEMLGVALGELIARTANLLERVKDGGEFSSVPASFVRTSSSVISACPS